MNVARKPKPAPPPVIAPPRIDPWDPSVNPKSLPLDLGNQAFVEALDRAADLLKASHGDPGIGSVVQAAANELRRFFYRRENP